MRGGLRVLSGADAASILGGFGFEVIGGRTHINLRRTGLNGNETLVIPAHSPIAKGTLRVIFSQASRHVPQGSELGLTGFTSCGKAESMGLLIRSLPDGRLALRTHATFAVAASAGPLFPDRGQTESGRR